MPRVLAGESPTSTRITECYRSIIQYALATPVLAHPSRRRTPIQQSSAVGFTGDRGTVHLNQDGTVDYTFKCTSAKYSEEVFFLLNIAGLTVTGAGIRGFLSAVRG